MITDSHDTTDSHIHRDLIDQVMNSVPAMHFGADALLRLISIEETTSVPTACVSCGEYSTLKINPIFCTEHANTKEKMTMLILHEMHHIVLGHTRLFARATPLDNLVFDAVINAMLCQAYPDPASTALFRDLYDDKHPLYCFLRPASGWSPTGFAVTPPALRKFPELAALHRRLYKTGCTYSELREALCNSGLVIEVDMKVLIGGHDDDANGSDERNLQSVSPALASVIQKVVGKWPSSVMLPKSSLDDLFATHTIKVPKTKRDSLRRLIRKVSVTGKTGDVRRRDLSLMSIQSPIPRCDRRGMVLRAIGGRQIMHSHQIEHRKITPNGERVHVYMDVSGSMTKLIPPLYGAIRDCSDCVFPKVHLFSTIVSDVTLKELAEGKVNSTGGTDISCVVRHMQENKVQRAVIVTDGHVGTVTAAELSVLNGVFIGTALTGAGGSRNQMAEYVNVWIDIIGGGQ